MRPTPRGTPADDQVQAPACARTRPRQRPRTRGARVRPGPAPPPAWGSGSGPRVGPSNGAAQREGRPTPPQACAGPGCQPPDPHGPLPHESSGFLGLPWLCSLPCPVPAAGAVFKPRRRTHTHPRGDRWSRTRGRGEKPAAAPGHHGSRARKRSSRARRRGGTRLGLAPGRVEGAAFSSQGVEQAEGGRAEVHAAPQARVEFVDPAIGEAVRVDIRFPRRPLRLQQEPAVGQVGGQVHHDRRGRKVVVIERATMDPFPLCCRSMLARRSSLPRCSPQALAGFGCAASRSPPRPPAFAPVSPPPFLPAAPLHDVGG